MTDYNQYPEFEGLNPMQKRDIIVLQSEGFAVVSLQNYKNRTRFISSEMPDQWFNGNTQSIGPRAVEHALENPQQVPKAEQPSKNAGAPVLDIKELRERADESSASDTFEDYLNAA